MKISPRKYACALAILLEKASEPRSIIRNFLSLLRRRKHFRLLPKILTAFGEEYRKRKGITKVELTYPEKFKESVAELEKRLSEKLATALETVARASPTLIGGFRVHIEDTLIDASLETKLRTLYKKLTR